MANQNGIDLLAPGAEAEIARRKELENWDSLSPQQQQQVLQGQNLGGGVEMTPEAYRAKLAGMPREEYNDKYIAQDDGGTGLMDVVDYGKETLEDLTGRNEAEAFKKAGEEAIPVIGEYKSDVLGAAAGLKDRSAETDAFGNKTADEYASKAEAGLEPLAGFKPDKLDSVISTGMTDTGAVGAASDKAKTAADATKQTDAAWAAYGVKGPNTQAGDFYNNALTGNDPYYDRLSKELSDTMQRSAVATGHGGSGRALKMEADAQANLKAQQYNKMADMAAKAQELGNQSDITGAEIAKTATSAQQAANELMVLAGTAVSEDERQRYTALANAAMEDDRMGLDWRTNLSTATERAASGEADARLKTRTLSDLLYGQGTDAELAGLKNSLEGWLSAHGMAVSGAQAQGQGTRDTLSNLLAAWFGYNKGKG